MDSDTCPDTQPAWQASQHTRVQGSGKGPAEHRAHSSVPGSRTTGWDNVASHRGGLCSAQLRLPW